MKKWLLSLLAILILFEEWLWDLLTVLGAALSRVLRLARFDAWLSRASPHTALFALGLPVLIVSPLNLMALGLLAHGRIVQGILLEGLVKLLGTLLVARVFRLTRPALMSFGWFAAIYTTIIGWLDWAHERIRNTAVYRWGRMARTRAQAWAARLLRKP